MRKTIIPTLALLFIPNVLIGQALIYQFDGQNVDDSFGASVSAAGDVNGDGFADVIVGAYLADSASVDSGSAYVYSGVDGSLLYQWHGQNSYNYFGKSVSAAGDVNGDGFDDVIVGADFASNNGAYSGAAYVYSGADGSLLYQWDGQSANDYFGTSVSAASDFNGDGFDDVLIGEPGADNNGLSSGSAYVYSGADGSLLHQWNGQNPYDYFGESVSLAGNLNGDNYDDVIIGASEADNNGTNSGSAYVYSGSNGLLLHQWHGQTAGERLGVSVSAAGDVNNDAFDDVVIGTRDSPLVYVYSGADGSLLYQLYEQYASNNFGLSVSAAGDADGDGFDDVLVGEPNASYFAGGGAAYVYSGVNGSLLYQWHSQNNSEYFGVSVSAAGDVDGNGLDDVIIGAQYANSNGLSKGSAYVYSGKNRSPTAANDNVVTRYDLAINIDVLSNDSDPDGDFLSVIATGTPNHGSAIIAGNEVVYTPDPGWSGTDSFIYFIEDTSNITASATITVEVTRPSYAITNFIAGHYALFEISDAPPNSLITIGYSLAGAGPTYTPLGYVDMSHPIQRITPLRADSLGNAWLVPLVPAWASGITFYTQAKCGHMLSDSLALTVQ